MLQGDPAKQAFLRQKMPTEYAEVRPVIEEFRAWLNDPARPATRDAQAARKPLVGLEDPESNTPIPQLQQAVRRSIESARLDPENAVAFFMLARAMTELARLDEETYHPVPLREAADFAERSRQLAPKVGKAWRAVIEIYVRLRRTEMVSDLMAELQRGGFAPGTHALLAALDARTQGHLEEAIEWYEKAMGFIAEPHRRAEAYAQQAFCRIAMKQRSEAERSFMLALLEGGLIPWIAHNWSVLKYEQNNIAGAAELNRRCLEVDPQYGPALQMQSFLMNYYAQQGAVLPAAAALQEELLRGIALPGLHPFLLQQHNLPPWEPPKRGTRARATRTFRTGLEGD
ncbi:MAG: hypothetical protein IT463_05175 [Planctomycetes bacterium]|nr:hypothetical protein [Planctomycetota bacterium]